MQFDKDLNHLNNEERQELEKISEHSHLLYFRISQVPDTEHHTLPLLLQCRATPPPLR